MLSGKNALVTGAGGTLGREIGRALKEHHAVVFGAYRELPREADNHAPDVSLACDLTDEKSVLECFQEIREKSGGPDIIVHCAGGFASEGSIVTTSMGTWNRMMDMNLKSSFLVMREGLRYMERRAYGRIILISALSAYVPGPGASAYKVSKAGLKTLVESAEAEKHRAGVTINALAPSILDTPQNRADMPAHDHQLWVSPRALAETVLYLCTESGGAISGSVIPFP